MLGQISPGKRSGKIAVLLINCLLMFLMLTATANEQRLHIMLTNDDGINAPGILAVEQALVKSGHRVTVVAPATQQSGASSAITGGKIGLKEIKPGHWAVEGRPVDAVRIGLGFVLAEDPPDLVISGANHGQNVGQDTIVSGTVGAALEALRSGIPSIALSIAVNLGEARLNPPFKSTHEAMDNAANLLARLIDDRRLIEISDQTLVNINYPAKGDQQIAGITIAELSDQALTGGKYTRLDDTAVQASYQTIDSTRAARDAEMLEKGYVTIGFLRKNLAVSKGEFEHYKEMIRPVILNITD